MAENETPGPSAEAVSRNMAFNIKLPPFWPQNAENWLALCETKFEIFEITRPVIKYVALLEALPSNYRDKLYNIPKPEDPECYNKLTSQIETIFAKDESETLDLLLNDLTLGDRSPTDLTRHLQTVSGLV